MSNEVSNNLMVPEASNVPAHIRNAELAQRANADAAAGISTGQPPRIKLSGKQFVLVDGNGDETPFPQSKMVLGPDDAVYLPIILLRAKLTLSKNWYVTAFNPALEAVAPDCFSLDALRPDPASLVKQAESCVVCPQNAFGSGKDQAGNATKGKACADTKILAAFVPGFGIHSLKVPPASLKNFGLYVKQLSSAGVPLNMVKTFVGFDPVSTFPVLVFKFGGYVGEALIPKLAELAESQEAEDIINPTAYIQVAQAPALPAPAKKGTLQLSDDDLGLGIETAHAAPAAPAAPATAVPVTSTRVVAPASVVAPAAPEPAKAPPSDAELMAELGL